MPVESNGTNEARMYWLNVKSVADGLFPTEATVEVATADGDVQFFVSRQQVDEEHKRVRVRLLDENERFALVQVAGAGGSTVAKVVKAGLLSAA
jgi:hypothetical protein